MSLAFRRRPISLTTRATTPSTRMAAAKKTKLLVVAKEDRPELVHLEALSPSVEVVGVGTAFDDLSEDRLAQVECLLVDSVGVTTPQIEACFNKLPSLKWLHSNMAGLDIIKFPAIFEASPSSVVVTNSKGTYSSALAEYALFAAKYFALEYPRLARQKAEKNWEKSL